MPFSDLARRVFSLYGEARFAEALGLIDTEAENFPDHREQIAYFRICLQARLGQLDDAIATLRAALEAGLSFSSSQLHEESDLDALRGRDDFERLAGESARRYAERCPPPPPLRILQPETETIGLLARGGWHRLRTNIIPGSPPALVLDLQPPSSSSASSGARRRPGAELPKIADAPGGSRRAR